MDEVQIVLRSDVIVPPQLVLEIFAEHSDGLVNQDDMPDNHLPLIFRNKRILE